MESSSEWVSVALQSMPQVLMTKSFFFVVFFLFFFVFNYMQYILTLFLLYFALSKLYLTYILFVLFKVSYLLSYGMGCVTLVLLSHRQRPRNKEKTSIAISSLVNHLVNPCPRSFFHKSSSKLSEINEFSIQFYGYAHKPTTDK